MEDVVCLPQGAHSYAGDAAQPDKSAAWHYF